MGNMLYNIKNINFLKNDFNIEYIRLFNLKIYIFDNFKLAYYVIFVKSHLENLQFSILKISKLKVQIEK